MKGQKWEQFRDRHGDTGRDLVLYLGRKVCGLRLKELAAVVGVKEYATVAMAVKRFEARLNKEQTLRQECQKVNQLIFWL
jgi:chromosomal replication initiation ATPase DnaA